MSIINTGGRQLKSRELQEKDFTDFISHIAEPNCTVCSGRGWSLWSDREQSLIPCQCVQINAHIERVKMAGQKEHAGKPHIEMVKG